MLILLRFMETHGVELGYLGDKIRYIRNPCSFHH